MKKLNWIFFLIFLLGAVLQFNDPDPVIWMAMWGAAAGACLLFGLGLTRISHISSAALPEAEEGVKP